MPDFTPKPGFTFPGPVPKEALAYFKAKQLRVGFSYLDVWGAEHASSFTVAKVMQLDILDDIQSAAKDALANGTTFASFKKTLTPVLQEKGWWGIKDAVDPLTGKTRTVQLGSPRRLRTIYNANMRSARAAGQWERIQRNKKTHPYLLYYLGPSENHREEHVKWAGRLLRADHPFWQTHYPPNGWGCKCGIRQVSKREYDRLVKTGRYLTKAPAIKTTPWTNKRTGEVLDVPVGLDPAWMRNPGQDRVRIVREQLTQKVVSADQRYAAAAVKQVVDSPILDSWMISPQGQLPIAVLGRDMQNALGSQSQVVRLSVDTLDRQSKRHAELTAAHYRFLPDLIQNGVVIKQAKNKLVYFQKIKNRWHKAVIKTTSNNKDVFLVSYHLADAKELKREMDQGTVLRSIEK